MTVYTDASKLERDLQEALTKIANAFDGSHYVKLGIMGGDVDRGSSDDGDVEATNSEIGFIHEMGSLTRNIDTRSWLRMPISYKAMDIIGAIAKKRKKIEKSAKKGGKDLALYKFLGIASEAVIQDAFDTQGFGQWSPNKKGTSPLIDTAQLRKAVTSKVEEKV